MLRKLKYIGNPPYYSHGELFYFSASVRLQVSDRPDCLQDEVRQPCSCGISPQTLTGCGITAGKPSSALFVWKGTESDPVCFQHNKQE